MTSKEKAIEALKIGDKVWERFNNRVVTLYENHRTDTTTKWWHIEEDEYEWREDSFTTIPYYVQMLLLKPTIDDAIKVVEEIKQDMAKTYSIVCETIPQKAIATTVDNILYDILTALKGLKEGK